LLFIEISGKVTKSGFVDLEGGIGDFLAVRPDKNHVTVLHLVGDGDPREILGYGKGTFIAGFKVRTAVS